MIDKHIVMIDKHIVPIAHDILVFDDSDTEYFDLMAPKKRFPHRWLL